MWQSYSSKKKEGITNGAIFVGGLTHSLNIAVRLLCSQAVSWTQNSRCHTHVQSIVLINFQGEGLLAQSPYIATSACCVVLDIFVRPPRQCGHPRPTILIQRLLCLCAAPLP